MNTNEREPDELFADCRDGNHKECLFQWPDPTNPEMALTCSCSCHKKSSSITPTQLAEWRAVVEKATPEPWEDKGGDAFGVTMNGQCLLATSYMLAPNSVFFRFDGDREFVIVARTALPRLLDEIETKTAEIERLNTCPWCGAAMERIPCDGGDELGCTSEKCVSFAIGVWCYADSLRDEVEAGRQRLAKLEPEKGAINFRNHVRNYEKVFSAWIGDGSKVYNLGDCAILIWRDIESLRSQLREAQTRIETLRETADRATVRAEEAQGEVERLRDIFTCEQCDNPLHEQSEHRDVPVCSTCWNKLAAELTALRDERTEMVNVLVDLLDKSGHSRGAECDKCNRARALLAVLTTTATETEGK